MKFCRRPEILKTTAIQSLEKIKQYEIPWFKFGPNVNKWSSQCHFTPKNRAKTLNNNTLLRYSEYISYIRGLLLICLALSPQKYFY